jgi:hypothetical protein
MEQITIENASSARICPQILAAKQEQAGWPEANCFKSKMP